MKNLNPEILQDIDAHKVERSRIAQVLHQQRDAIIEKLLEVDKHLAALRFPDEGPDEDPGEDPTSRDSALRAYISTELGGAEHCATDTVVKQCSAPPSSVEIYPRRAESRLGGSSPGAAAGPSTGNRSAAECLSTSSSFSMMASRCW